MSNGVRILWVDDEIDLLKPHILFLKGKGYEVETANNAYDAIDMVGSHPYDLIILEYGLNVATERGRNYDNYQKGLLTAINHLKECFPQAGILLLSVGDRDYKTETGDLRTMPGVKNLIRYQQNIAAESGIAFWNMFEAMGGEGSMAKLVHAKPSMANYDYTHINFRGGKHLAGLLYETLIYGKEQYDRRRAYEKE